MAKQKRGGFDISGKLDGVDEAVRALDDVKKSVRNKLKRKALTKGSQIVSKQAKQLAPKDSGLLRKSLAYRVRTYRQSGVMVSYVGPRLGFRQVVNGKPRDPRYYAHLAERGRKAVKVKKARWLSDGRTIFGRQVKAAPGSRFLRRSYEGSKGPAQQQMVEIIRTGLEQEAKK